MMDLHLARRRFSRFLPLAVLGVVFFLLLERFSSSPSPSSSSSSPADLAFSELDSAQQAAAASRRPVQFKPSSVDWSNAKQFFPEQQSDSVVTLPRGTPKTLPRIQATSFPATPQQLTAQTQERRAAVKDAFLRSWHSYKEHAWTWDELRPVSGGGKNTFGGWAATLIDALDTLWMMGLYDDFYEAAQVSAQLDWANTTESSANLFETTIRHLGGLLSAYDLSGEQALLDKAKELGDMLYMAFDTPNRLPGFWFDWNNARTGRQVAGTADPSASPASLGLEFTRLAQLTGEDKYYRAIDRVRAFLYRTQEKTLIPGMWPRQINFQKERVDEHDGFTLGALADSLYEYLPKMYILTGGLAETYQPMYRKAMNAVMQHIIFRPMLPGNEDILFAGDAWAREDGSVDKVPEAQHLGCFTGGMFLLGGKTFNIQGHVSVGEKLSRGCAWAYEAMPTGLMPEIFGLLECPALERCPWDVKKWTEQGDQRLKEGFRNARDAKYILRPEAIESIFYLYRVTGNEELRDVAWKMFEAIVKATETPIAYSAIADVTVPSGQTEKTDSMESFWLAETLKYFYLIFSPPDLIDLDEWVLNTEAHPFRRPK